MIVDAAIGNPSYAEDRAIEMIRDAQRVLKAPAQNPDVAAENLANYHRLTQKALGLLALAKAVRSPD